MRSARILNIVTLVSPQPSENCSCPVTVRLPVNPDRPGDVLQTHTACRGIRMGREPERRNIDNCQSADVPWACTPVPFRLAKNPVLTVILLRRGGCSGAFPGHQSAHQGVAPANAENPESWHPRPARFQNQLSLSCPEGSPSQYREHPAGCWCKAHPNSRRKRHSASCKSTLVVPWHGQQMTTEAFGRKSPRNPPGAARRRVLGVDGELQPAPESAGCSMADRSNWTILPSPAWYRSGPTTASELETV